MKDGLRGTEMPSSGWMVGYSEVMKRSSRKSEFQLLPQIAAKSWRLRRARPTYIMQNKCMSFILLDWLTFPCYNLA